MTDNLTLEAGREIDALVAEKVMGLPVRWAVPPYMHSPLTGRHPWLYGIGPDGCNYDWASVACYSTEISVAWLVVKKLRYDQHAVRIELNRFAHLDLVTVCRNDTHPRGGSFTFSSGIPSTELERVPLAICLAALKALE